jgi:hypothetical protein
VHGVKKHQTIEEYIDFLSSKGFRLRQDAVKFILFGQQYTGASDWLVNIAIETTLKIQKEFDGSYYLSLLEQLVDEKVANRKEAFQFLKKKGIE